MPIEGDRHFRLAILISFISKRTGQVSTSLIVFFRHRGTAESVTVDEACNRLPTKAIGQCLVKCKSKVISSFNVVDTVDSFRAGHAKHSASLHFLACPMPAPTDS